MSNNNKLLLKNYESLDFYFKYFLKKLLISLRNLSIYSFNKIDNKKKIRNTKKKIYLYQKRRKQMYFNNTNDNKYKYKGKKKQIKIKIKIL